jgi:pilus assembly protein CpaB
MGGTKKALGVAMVLGLAAALLSWQYVQRQGQAARQAQLVPVIVAAADIPVRTQVQPPMLAVKQVPADARHPKAFTSLEQVNGKVTNLPISTGEQVLSTKFFERKEDSGLAFRVPPGKRALSVNVQEVVTVSGLVLPGDFVDVIVLFPGTGAEQDMASVVLQDVEVLAIAQSLHGPATEPQRSGPLPGQSEPAKPAAQPNPAARTATLAVTPEQAQRLVLAETKGSIRLALRAVEDHGPADVPSLRLGAVKQ